MPTSTASPDKTSRWSLSGPGRDYRVEIAGGVSRTSSWYVDDELVASKKSTENDVVLDTETLPTLAVGVKFTDWGRVRRVTLFEGDTHSDVSMRAVLGTGGIDFDPEPGSPAALRQQRIREHPRRHAVLALARAIAKVAVPLLVALVVVRFAIRLPGPHWQIPWPDIDLPRIPWPEIPWPDINLPDWQLPAWLTWVADRLKYIAPVVVAVVFARREIRRQRKQDALKAELRRQREVAAGSATASPAQQDRESSGRA